jgi:hypothetical protein
LEQNNCDEGNDDRNEDNNVLEEDEQNDGDEGDMIFLLILTDRWEIEEDYWDSADEDDDPDYDPHKYIERRMIMKNISKKYHSVRDFSNISVINEINAQSQS